MSHGVEVEIEKPPHSSIFVTPSRNKGPAPSSSATPLHNSDLQDGEESKPGVGDITHFRTLVGKEEIDPAIVRRCQGAHACFNCGREIKGKIYFYPVTYSKLGEFGCSPIPHCRPGCALRSVHDLRNKFDLVSLFHTMYGVNVTAAPPRSLLFVKDGLSLERYHSFMDNDVLLEEEEENIRSFMAPLRIAGAVFKNRVLSPQSVGAIDECSKTEYHTMGMDDTEDAGASTCELSEVSPLDNLVSRVFDIDPSSRRIQRPS